MFYLKHKNKRLYLECDNVYTVCPICGAEHRVDLGELGSNFDLYALAVYCPKCSESVARMNHQKWHKRPLPWRGPGKGYSWEKSTGRMPG